jgi:hypothetical protein
MAQSIEVSIEGRARTTTTTIEFWRPSQNATSLGIWGTSAHLSLLANRPGSNCRRRSPELSPSPRGRRQNSVKPKQLYT